MERVRINDIINELRTWGVDTSLEYDENGEGWVLVHKEENQVQFIIHHGYEWHGTIYVDPAQVGIEIVNPSLKRIASKKLIVATARVNWAINNFKVKVHEPYSIFDSERYLSTVAA